MPENVVIDGVMYISSKRAADIHGYTHDYIGQLARSSKIVAKRIGALWYVLEDSLKTHKAKAESYVPQPPVRQAAPGDARSQHSGSYVGFDGKKYVSAVRAAELTGYTSDYVGQLARSGKILSQQVGGRWFVEFEALKAHKAEKDRLLGALQAESVGLQRQPSHQKIAEVTVNQEHFTYTQDRSDLIPTLEKKVNDQERVSAQQVREHAIPIRVIRTWSRKQDISPRRFVTHISAETTPKLFTKAFNSVLFSAIVGTILIVIVVSVGDFRQLSGYSNFSVSHSSNTMIESAFSRSMDTFWTLLRTFFSKELIYDRSQN